MSEKNLERDLISLTDEELAVITAEFAVDWTALVERFSALRVKVRSFRRCANCSKAVKMPFTARFVKCHVRELTDLESLPCQDYEYRHGGSNAGKK